MFICDFQDSDSWTSTVPRRSPMNTLRRGTPSSRGFRDSHSVMSTATTFSELEFGGFAINSGALMPNIRSPSPLITARSSRLQNSFDNKIPFDIFDRTSGVANITNGFEGDDNDAMRLSIIEEETTFNLDDIAVNGRWNWNTSRLVRELGRG